jgi:hypothetical protein
MRVPNSLLELIISKIPGSHHAPYFLRGKPKNRGKALKRPPVGDGISCRRPDSRLHAEHLSLQR